MKNKIKLGIMITLLISVAMIIVIGINAKPINQKDLEDIKKVIMKADTQAERNYIEAKTNHKKGTLIQNKNALLEKDSTAMRDTFSDDMAQKLKKVWVDDQIENVENGPDLVDCGTTDINIKDVSISDNIANVTATVTKYLIERVTENGKYYLDRMEGTAFNKYTLVNNGSKWKISEMEISTNLDAKHTLTEEK